MRLDHLTNSRNVATRPLQIHFFTSSSSCRARGAYQWRWARFEMRNLTDVSM